MTNIIKKVNINFNSYAIKENNKKQEAYKNQTRELQISIDKNAGKYDYRYIVKISNKDKSRYSEVSYRENKKQFAYYTCSFTQYFDFVSKEDEEKYYNALAELEAEQEANDKAEAEKELAKIDLSHFDVYYYPNYGSKSDTNLPTALKEYETGLIALIEAKEIELENIAYSDTRVLKNMNIEKLKELAKKGNEILEAKKIKKAEKEAEKKQKIKDAIAKAKATGEKQVINAYSYENNYNECITVYEMIDGNGYVTKVKENAY